MLGPLATYAEPHCYDLCELHAQRLTAPRGWEVLRLEIGNQPRTPGPDELSALVDAVREAEAEEPAEKEASDRRSGRHALEPPADFSGGRRSHLRILREEVREQS